ncbi:hypothetical protein ACFL6M_03595 [Candidatus Eisenbacteria bacterium]|uniref:Uncharacterized protein n=1 Tax=Eiseniibacteriota bacterium TaxID=2212470 RepID=A0ABV6YKF9_UNCEI
MNTTDPVVADLAVEDAMASGYELHPNDPNPFKLETMIRYTLP